MKKTVHKISLVLLFIFCMQANAQKINYKKQASKQGSNFFEIVKETRKQFLEKNKNSKGVVSKKNRKAIKQFERWVFAWKDKVNSDGTFPKNEVNKEEYINLLLNNTSLHARTSSTTKAWEQIGPTVNVTQNGYTAYPGLGRINVVAVDPNNEQIMYAGAAAGGVWKTTDGGANWTPKTDDFAGLGVTDIIIDPANSSILYMATGDEDAAHISSIGVFKSIDAGDTWAATGLTFSLNENEYITDLSFAPGSSTTIFALTNTEIRRTTDSGDNWSNILVSYPFVPFTERYQNIIFDPNDANKVVVSDFYDGIYFSTDGGTNFKMHNVFQGGNNQRKLKITSTTSDTDFFYGQSQDGIFRKYRYAFDDTAADLISSTTITGYNSQGGYNQCLAVSPTDKNTIIVAGVRAYKSTDNGATFSVYLNPYNDPAGVGFYVHPDHHHLSFLADGATVINGHDGGVHKGLITANTGWTDLSNGLVISQPYNISITQSLNGDDYMMGNQDNDGFSKVSKSGTQQWVACLAGDGTATGIDISDSNIRYLGGTQGGLSRTNDGYSSSYNSATTILSQDATNAAFVSPLALHPTVAATIYAGHGDVKKSTDRGDNWAALTSGLNQTEFLDVSLNDNSTTVRIFAIGVSGGNKILKRSIDDGVNWTPIANADTGLTFNSVYAVPNTNTVYATVSGYTASKKVYKSTDNGNTWANISGDIPNIIMYKIIVDPNKTNETIYLGTELGLYFTDNSTTNWVKLGTGLPNVRISDIEIGKNNGNVYVGTFGRGLWVYDDQKYFDNVTNVNWSETTNWEGKTLPTATDDVFIKGTENLTLNVNTAVAKSLEIEDGALLTIEKNRDLTVENNFSSTATNRVVKINSDASDSGVLIVKGTSTGKIEFERGGLLQNKWSLVSVPLEGQKIKNFAELASNNIRINTTPDPDRYAISFYDDSNAAMSKWVYYDVNVAANLTFTKTKGYSISTSADGAVNFEGTLLTSNQPVAVAANEWNAIGNPYTAYYPANKNSNVSFINENTANLDSQAVYVWDNSQTKYVAFSELTPSAQKGLTPGQGFFVKTKVGVTSLSFNKDKRAVKPATGNNVFNRTEENTPYVQLFVKKGTIKINTDIVYNDNATKGLDTKLDILNFDGSEFDVSTRLLEQSIGKNYTSQSLPNNEFENQIIPINLKVKANEEVTFSALSKKLPSDLNIYLEDKITNSFYKLNNTDSFYNVTPTEDLNDVGRFYLHLSRQSLTIDETQFDNVKVFNVNRELLVNGLNDSKITLQLFDITGKQLLVAKQKGSGKNTFNLANINTGVYLVKVSFAKGTITRKIIIK